MTFSQSESFSDMLLAAYQRFLSKSYNYKIGSLTACFR